MISGVDKTPFYLSVNDLRGQHGPITLSVYDFRGRHDSITLSVYDFRGRYDSITLSVYDFRGQVLYLFMISGASMVLIHCLFMILGSGRSYNIVCLHCLFMILGSVWSIGSSFYDSGIGTVLLHHLFMISEVAMVLLYCILIISGVGMVLFHHLFIISEVRMVLLHCLFIISGVGMVYGQSDSSPPEDKLPPMVTCYNCVYAVVDGQVSGQSNCQEKFRKNAISQDECRGACYVSSY